MQLRQKSCCASTPCPRLSERGSNGSSALRRWPYARKRSMDSTHVRSQTTTDPRPRLHNEGELQIVSPTTIGGSMVSQKSIWSARRLTEDGPHLTQCTETGNVGLTRVDSTTRLAKYVSDNQHARACAAESNAPHTRIVIPLSLGTRIPGVPAMHQENNCCTGGAARRPYSSNI